MITEPLTLDTLQSIWDFHDMGHIEQLVQPSGGAVNRLWIVNDAYVIRFDVIEWQGGISRYTGEKWAYEMLSSTDVPVPQVIALDTRKTLAPYDYLIMTKLPGKTISASLPDLTMEAQHGLAYAAGQHLAALHSYELDQFGLLFEIFAGTNSPDWTAFVNNFYEDYGQQCVTMGVVSADIWARIQAVMVKMQPLFASVQRGRLVHGDYHLSNLLQQDGRLTGILDFEWATSGDASWDFRIDDQLEGNSPGSREAFYAGYISRRPLPEQHRERVSFYRIGLYLDYLATFSPLDENEAATTLPVLIHELNWLEMQLYQGEKT